MVGRRLLLLVEEGGDGRPTRILARLTESWLVAAAFRESMTQRGRLLPFRRPPRGPYARDEGAPPDAA